MKVMRFRRAAGEPTHIEIKDFGKSWPNVALCGLDVTDLRKLAPYAAASEKAIEFWTTVHNQCGAVMDEMDPAAEDEE